MNRMLLIAFFHDLFYFYVFESWGLGVGCKGKVVRVAIAGVDINPHSNG